MKTLHYPFIFQNIRKLSYLLILGLLISGSLLQAQSDISCGIIQKIQNPDNVDLKDASSYAMDRFGNFHGRADAKNSRSAGCTAGYFKLNFLDDFDFNIQEVTCKVFEDLSVLIPQRSQQLSCGEDIPNSNVVINISGIDTPGIGGTGSPLYAFPLGYGFHVGRNCRKLILSNPYMKINGGQWHGSDMGESNPDGLMEINTEMDWYFGSGIPPAGQVDLYSVVLHEALHILGFAGTSDTDIMTLWDHQMHAVDSYQGGGTNSGIDRIYTSDCEKNCWDLNSNLFTDFNDLATLVGANCSGSQDIVIGENGLAPISGGGGVTPSVGGAYNNMISHLNNTCNGQNENYVMSPVLSSGTVKRTISNSEIEILCALGYQTQNCDGCFAISQQNFYKPIREEYINCCNTPYYGCVGEEIFVSENDLLCNDLSNGDLSITDLWIPGSLANDLTITPTTGGWIISTTKPRFYTLIYTVEGCDCKMHNNLFDILFEACPPCQTPACENLICNGDFEAYPVQTGAHLGFPFHFTGTFNNSTDIKETAGNKFLFAWKSNTGAESAVFELQSSIAPDCELDFNFDASANGFVQMQLWGSEFPPCDINDVYVEYGCPTTTECADWTYEPVCIGTIPITNFGTVSNPNFQPYELPTWLNDSSFPINYIVVSPTGALGTSLHVDNLAATTSCSNANFNYSEDCGTVSFQSLGSAISHEWDFGDNNFSTEANPTHIYFTSGTYSVTHTVTNECGVESETIMVEVIICDCGFDLEVRADSDMVPCEGGCVTLMAEGADNYFWEPADLVDNPNSAVTQACITETTTFIVSAWNDEDDCVEKWPITITVDTKNCPGECGVELVEECLPNGFVKLTVYQDGLQIPMFGAACCVSWTGVPGIPTIGCPQPPGLPAQNFNGLTVPLDIGYSVEVVCGECTFEYSGRAGELCGETNGKERGQLIETRKLNKLTVFPNPAHQQIELLYRNLRPGDRYQIVNSLGQSFFHNKLENTRSSVSLESLESGVYCLIISDKNGQVQAQELFVKR